MAVRRPDERGSVLVMVVGIVAALAVMAGGLVMLTINVQGNSSRDGQAKKSFNVSEAALDAALFKLGSSWPDASSPADWTAAEQQEFRDQFDESVFPNPRSGSFSSMVFYDNVDTNGDGVIGPGDEPYDAGPGTGGDGFMYVEVQSGVGKRTTRLQAQVQRVTWDNIFPEGVAVAADGEVVANNHKQPVGVEVLGDRDYAVIKSALPVDPDVYQPGEIVPLLEPMPVVDNLLDPAIISDLIDMAKPDDYYSGSERPNSDADWEGIVVIQTTGTVEFPNSGVFNSDGVGANKMPGVLIVVGPNYPDGPSSGGIDTNGNAQYWGLVYTDGDWRNTGTSEVHGMLLAKGTVTSVAVEMKGDRDVLYNNNCILNLNRMIPLKARLVPNTWREITPVLGE
jgi:hypothetical protein